MKQIQQQQKTKNTQQRKLQQWATHTPPKHIICKILRGVEKKHESALYTVA